MFQVSVWNADKVERLRELWARGLPASQIARELHTTRNAVLGKVFRLDLPLRTKVARAPAYRPSRVRLVPPKPIPPSQVPRPPPPPPPAQHVRFLDLGDRQCRYPLGADDYCGAECVPRRSYCPAHLRISAQAGR